MMASPCTLPPSDGGMTSSSGGCSVLQQYVRHVRSHHRISDLEAVGRLQGLVSGLNVNNLDDDWHASLTEESLSPAQLQACLTSLYGGVPDSPQVPNSAAPHNAVELMLWNVRGLLSSLPAALQLTRTHKPLLLVFTEAHTMQKDHDAACLDHLKSRYQITMTSQPSTSKIRRPAGGLLIGISKEVPRQCVRKHACPKGLEGHMLHVSVHVPTSKALHVLAVYWPPMSNPRWKQLMDQAFEYVAKIQIPILESGGRLLIGGDMNATIYPHHRSSCRSHPIDQCFRAHLERLRLGSCGLYQDCAHS